MENKFKHLKSFENYGHDYDQVDNKPMDKMDMVSMLDNDDSCEYSKDELMKMSNEELEDMCSNINEGFFDFFVNMINNMDKGGKAKDFLEDMPKKIKSYIRLGKKTNGKKGLMKEPTAEQLSKVTSEAEKDGYLGNLSAKDGKLVYIPAKDVKSRSKASSSI